MVNLDASSLGNALARLCEGLVRHQREPFDEQLRDGLIQRFEFTYELGHRLLRRYVITTAASPDDVERMSFADLIRTGKAQGLSATPQSGLRTQWQSVLATRLPRGAISLT